MVSDEAEQFITALGVRVERVDDLDGRCAVYAREERMMIVCASLCPGRGKKALMQLLARIS